ncbi:MAG: TonB-dependent receptor, partial [Hyphomonadaceae bacterium]|nr:TonB-dependent receptor [Hyphomonadaceae bacterium]
MTCKSSAKTVSFLLCTTLFYVFGMSAHAQIEDEIIVTATKKEESAQDVGISLSAFTEEGLELGGVDDVSRLEFLVPGVNFAYVGNDAKFNVRGANSTNTFGDNSSIVGAFVDGVYKARASQQTRAFFDVSRVEFLKGPQGTLYGRNTFAGALNLYTNAPDLDEYSAGAEFGYGRFDRAEFEGFVNVPVNDTFGIRVAGFYDKSDGYIDNTAGPDVGAQDDKGVRVSTLWQPNDNFNAIARYTYIVEDGREAGLFGYILTCRNEQANGLTDPLGPRRDCANPVRGSGGAPVYGETSGPWQIAQDYVPLVDLKEHVAQLELNMDFGGIVGKSITSWTDFRNNIGFDFDFSPLPNQVGGYDEEAEYFTQEFQILSDYDSPLQWQAGVYYSKDELFQSFTLYQATMRDDSVRGTVTLNQGEDDETTLTLLDGTPITSRDINLNGFFADSQVIDTEYFGIYGQVEYSLGDNLRLIGGLRYNSEDKELTGGGSNFTGDLNGDGGVDRVVNVVDGFSGATNLASLPRNNAVFSYNFDATDQIIVEPDTYDNVSWRAGVEFDVNP